MTQIILKKRENTGSQPAAKMRRAGDVPGIIYGEGIASRNFSIPEAAVNKILKHQGGSALFDVELEGEGAPVKAILQALQKDPVTDRPVHIDLYQVRMDKTLRTEIPLHFIGIAPAIKDLGGTLVKQVDHLPIECLPGDLVQAVEVSIDLLKTFEDHIKAKDLKLPSGIKLHLDPETIILSVSAPRSEAELAALSGEVKADVSAIEVLTEKKKEGEEGEGEKEGEEKTTPVEKK